jgi:hypothetical protein
MGARTQDMRRARRGRMALLKVHGESDYGAHRLPAGETAAKKRERGRPAGQAVKLFENRLLLVSKAMAPLVMTGEFYALPQSEVNMLR